MHNFFCTLLQIMTEGVKAEFDVEPKKLTFEHILMYRVEKQSITMMNKCLIPLLWKFVGTEAFEEDFKISATIGFLKPLQETTVDFTFISQKVQPVLQKPLKIDVSIIFKICLKMSYHLILQYELSES